MKEIKKPDAWRFIIFILLSISAGAIIGVGATASLLANLYMGELGKLVGAFLFSLGIYAVVLFNLKLFTGMIADIPTLGVKNWWQLAVCFVGNILGVALTAFLVRYCFVGEYVVYQATTLIQSKLNAENWAIKVLCSAILCGMLITVSVKSYKLAPIKSVSGTLGIILPVVVFAFCGFDHSVANMMYFYCLGEISWQIIGYVLLSIVGNVLGGVLFPCVTWLKQNKLKDE